MKSDSLKQILAFLTRTLEKNDFNDLVYYFDPLYVKIKKTIHEEKIKEIRKENKRNRDEK